MHSILSGNIKFGLINVPVRMYSASEDLSVGFRQVHDADNGAVRYKKVCEACGEELATADIRKAYDVGGQVIKFTDKDLDDMRPSANKEINLIGFCKLSDIPIVALGKPYYVGTETVKRGGVGKPFELLHKSLAATKKVAIVMWTYRSSENMGVLIPNERGFLLKQLLYDEQIRAPEIDVIEGEVSDDLVEKGMKLVDKLSINFKLADHKETYSNALKDLIERRAMGEEIKPEDIVKPVRADSLESELDQMLA